VAVHRDRRGGEAHARDRGRRERGGGGGKAGGAAFVDVVALRLSL
jgi:hypothetical protein